MTHELDRRFLLGGLAGAAGAGALAAIARGGPLNPPAGGVAPTGKTLTSVEPRTEINAANTPGFPGSMFTITQPGSYYLAADITAAANQTVIGVYGQGVTIDLNGFAIRNVAGGVAQAVALNGGVKGVTICNGSFVSCSPTVINGFIGTNCTLRDVALVDCPGAVYLGDRALVERCLVNGPLNDGLLLGADSIVRDCVVIGNAPGFTGIGVGAGSLVQGCVVSGFGRGVNIGAGAVRSCTLRSNVVGVYSSGPTAIEGNACDQNGTGVFVESSTGRARIADNHVTRSTGTGASAAGIVVNQTGCVVEGNTLMGNHTNLRVTSQFSLIVRNRMAFPGGGGNSVIAAGNSVGTIVNAASGGSPATTDANANIIF